MRGLIWTKGDDNINQPANRRGVSLLLCFKTIGAQSYGQLALKILCMAAKGGCCSTGLDTKYTIYKTSKNVIKNKEKERINVLKCNHL
jgi:hypothetical protein